MSDNGFWMVWNDGGRAPVVKHSESRLAIAEAERLARLNPGQTFIVLESVCARAVDGMQRTDLRPEAELPF